MNGSDLLLALLADEGVDYLFGNPGTTELPIMAALARQPDLRYVLGLQESVVLAMADGYARASGNLAACNVHVAPGLGNAVGALYNAHWWGAPVLVTVGQHEQGHVLTEPLLHGPLLAMAQPHVKWAIEVRRARDLVRIIRRAAKVALAPPSGPVFVSLPVDVLHEDAPSALGQRTRIDARVRPGDEALVALAERLLAARNPLIVAGHEVATADAFGPAARLAELLGAPVWQQTVPWGTHFPSEHPCFMGSLGRDQGALREILSDHDLLLALGADVFTMSLPSPIEPMPAGLAVVQVGLRSWELAKNYPAAMALQADVHATLDALLPILERRMSAARAEDAKRRSETLARANWSVQRARLRAAALEQGEGQPIDPRVLMLRAVDALPPDAIVVEEGLTAARSLLGVLPLRDPSAYFGLASGGLGFGVAGAIGVALARAPRPVLCVLGDGASMYGIQALWTAAHMNLPITYLVADNGGYQILRERLAALEGSNTFTGTWLREPSIDFAALARALGLAATAIEHTDQITPVLSAVLASARPHLVHAKVA